MPKLNQIIAVANGKKSHAQRAITDAYHKLQKEEPLAGVSRTYRPHFEEGEQLPPEKKSVQVTVKATIKEVADSLNELFDAVATQDWANCRAVADVKVGDRVLLEKVPVTHLLFLEKQLVDLHTFTGKLPTLDPAEVWHYDSAADAWATDPRETTRTKKVPRNHVMAEATKEHPAQVQVYHEDLIIGSWSTVKFSGAVPAAEKNAILERIRLLQDSVKFAREEANSLEVESKRTGAAVLEYVFGRSTS